MSILKNQKEVQNILALDWGKSKVGLALGNTENRIAFGHGSLENDARILEKISEIVKKEKVGKIILGKTDLWKDKKNAKQVEIFAESLKKKTGIEVEFFEEMFSTRMAKNNLKKSGKKNIKKLDDEEAARVILESWLENPWN